MRATFSPISELYVKPAFWGVDRDLKEVIKNIENQWEGVETAARADVKETEQAYLVSMDLPGVNKSNLNLSVEGDTISIVAERKKAFAQDEDTKVTIKRTVMMPKHVDKEKIQAHCEDGVLYLALPKAEQARPRKIEVSGTEKGAWTNLLESFKK